MRSVNGLLTIVVDTQLVGLPRKPNVVELLEEFKAHILALGTSSQ